MRSPIAPSPEMRGFHMERKSAEVSITNVSPSTTVAIDANSFRWKAGHESHRGSILKGVSAKVTIDTSNYERMKETQFNLYSRLNALTGQGVTNSKPRYEGITETDSYSQTSYSQTSVKTFPTRNHNGSNIYASNSGTKSLSEFRSQISSAQDLREKKSAMHSRLKVATLKAVETAELSSSEVRQELARKARGVACKYSSSLKVSNKTIESSYNEEKNSPLPYNDSDQNFHESKNSGHHPSQRKGHDEEEETMILLDDKKLPKTISIPKNMNKLAQRCAEKQMTNDHECGEFYGDEVKFSSDDQSSDTKSNATKSGQKSLGDSSGSKEDGCSSLDIPFEHYLNEASEGMRTYGSDKETDKEINQSTMSSIPSDLSHEEKTFVSSRRKANQERRKRIHQLRKLGCSTIGTSGENDIRSMSKDIELDDSFSPRYSKYLCSLEKTTDRLKEITATYGKKKKEMIQEENHEGENDQNHGNTNELKKHIIERKKRRSQKACDRLFQRAKSKQEEGKERRRQIQRAKMEKEAESKPPPPPIRSKKKSSDYQPTKMSRWNKVTF